MSRYTYAGKFVNATEGWFVKPVSDHFEIWVRSTERNPDGSIDPDRPHTSKRARRFEDEDDAHQYIEDMRQQSEEDYDEYRNEF